MLDVKMLGGLALAVDDRRLRVDVGASGRLLAAYLFQFPGSAHRKESLVRLFWPDLDLPHARGALNTALWRLRRLLGLERASKGGSNLLSNGPEVVLEPVAWLTVDTHCFASAARTALRRPNGSESSGDPQALEDVAERYSGPFLAGDELNWITAERETLQSTYIRCLTEIMRAYAISGRYEFGISAARRILAVDRFREPVERRLAVLLALNGQRAQALAELRRWRRLLRDEIGVDPMPETCALERSIASADLSSHLPALKRTHLVGECAVSLP